MNLFFKLAFSLMLPVFLFSCSSVGKNTKIKEFYCNGRADSPHRLTFIKGVKSSLLSPNDNIYDAIKVKYKKFVFEDGQFRVVGESPVGSVMVGFKKEDCDIGADNLSPYVCTFTVGGLKRFGCGEVNYIKN